MRWTFLGVGFVLGVLLLGAAGFALVPTPQGVHYHANFAVFVDGQRLDLSADRFMEDVAACSADPNLVDRRRIFDGEPGRTLEFYVNGLHVPGIHNRMIRSQDRVVVSVGAESSEEVLETQFPQVADDAGVYNQTRDPAGCAGAQLELGLAQRLRHAFWGA